MTLKDWFARYIPPIETEMRDCLSVSDPALTGYYGMLLYHLGWADEHFAPTHISSGKRIRPVLCLLACESAQGDMTHAIPAAAAIELLHNFSLIHDDIEDHSPTRRGRPSVWMLWGIPQATNSGDGLFTLAHLAIDRLSDRGVPLERVFAARMIFDQACLSLTHGQYLDLAFESHASVSVDEYMAMISGKTASLIGATAAIGATLAGSSTVQHYQTFGRELGLAFQIQDDILGIWGDAEQTGKPRGADLLRRKKSFPVLLGLADPGLSPAVRRLYSTAEPSADEAEELAAALEGGGVRQDAEQAARERADNSRAALAGLPLAAGPAEELDALAARAVGRER
jgi:geranylgeranyl diphosphate synthase type I